MSCQFFLSSCVVIDHSVYLLIGRASLVIEAEGEGEAEEEVAGAGVVEAEAEVQSKCNGITTWSLN